MPRTARRRRPTIGAALGAVALIAALVVVLPGGAQAAKPGNSQNAKACQKGGWGNLVRSDGSTFANQGECVSYAAKGGQLQPKPTAPATAQQLCADAGGTFQTGGTGTPPGPGAPGPALLWTCTRSEAFSDPTVIIPLRERCEADGGSGFGRACRGSAPSRGR